MRFQFGRLARPRRSGRRAFGRARSGSRSLHRSRSTRTTPTRHTSGLSRRPRARGTIPLRPPPTTARSSSRYPESRRCPTAIRSLSAGPKTARATASTWARLQCWTSRRTLWWSIGSPHSAIVTWEPSRVMTEVSHRSAPSRPMPEPSSAIPTLASQNIPWMLATNRPLGCRPQTPSSTRALIRHTRSMMRC